ncbi:MAG: choice-of-anchor tandem repeat GloVer-containing protein [Bacteroidota bacterium]
MSQGAIQGYGSIISVTPAGTLTPVLVFGPHAELGSNPGSPIRSGSGAMIGISNYGGQHSKGIIYRIDESLNYTRVLDLPEVPLHDGLFDNDLIQAPDNSLLGIGYPGSTADWGFIFSVREDGSQFNVVHEFGYASGPITMGTDGFVYGTSPDGGAFNHGLIYKMKPDGSSYTELHDFDTDTNGASPSSIMMASNGFLYGVTGQAGNNNIGTIFKLKPDGTDYQVIHHQAEIYSIQFGLTEFDGALFGVSYAGGDNGLGAIFTIRLDGSGFNILHNLDAQDGASPSGKIAIGNDGVIYGTNAAYGANGHGTFYTMKTDGSGFDVLHDFV